MRAGIAVEGDLVTSAGWPVAGASVEMWSRSGDGRSGRTTTDARGAFVVQRLAPGDYRFGTGSLGGNVFGVFLEHVDVPRGPIHVVLPTRTVRGRIVGGGRAGYMIMCSGKHGGAVAATTWSDLDGNFVLDGVSDGEWNIAATDGERNAVWQGRIDRDADVVVEIK
jgi:hypothetical protein